MFIGQISTLIVTLLSLMSLFLSLMQTTKEVNPHPCIPPCVNIWSVTFLFLFFLCQLLNVGACICHIVRKAKWSGPHHTVKMLHFVLFHSVICYTNSKVSYIHVNTTKLHNTTSSLVATCVVLQSLECIRFVYHLKMIAIWSQWSQN
jgi:hypothetical protein